MTAATATTNEHGWFQVASSGEEGEHVWIKVLENPKGADARVIEEGTAVLMDLQGWYVKDSDDDYQSNPTAITNPQAGRLFQSFQGFLILVGQGDLVRGVDLGLTALREGQTAYIACPPALALQNGTRKYKDCHVPANSHVLYQVKVTQIVQDTSRLNPYFTIQKALTRKNIANDLYQYECTAVATENTVARQRALDLYRTVARDMKDLLAGTYFASVEPNHPQRLQCQQLAQDCYNNIVVLYMQIKDYVKALDAVDLALQRTEGFVGNTSNLKALVRRAKICVYLATSTAKCQRAKEAIEAAQAALGFNHPTEEAELRKLQTLLNKREQQIQSAATTTAATAQ